MKHLFAFLFLLGITFSLSAQSVRERILLDDGWQFAFGNASSPEKDFGCGTEYFNYLTKAASIHNEGPYSPKFNPEKWGVDWKTVNLPHDWVVDLPYAKEASHSHGYKAVGYKFPENSVGWYRKSITVPQEDLGKHLYLQFDGIFRDARIWINGFYLGHEPSGYATQVYDITEYLNYGEENLICGCHARGGLVLRGCGHLPPCMAEQDGAVACSSFRRICIFHAGSSFRQGCAGDRSADEEFGKRPRLRQSMVPSA